MPASNNARRKLDGRAEARIIDEDIKERIYRLLADDCKKPSPQMIRESLAKLKELLYGREDIFKVLDWKEGSLYILDPLFLFYLRWGGAH